MLAPHQIGGLFDGRRRRQPLAGSLSIDAARTGGYSTCVLRTRPLPDPARPGTVASPVVPLARITAGGAGAHPVPSSLFASPAARSRLSRTIRPKSRQPPTVGNPSLALRCRATAFPILRPAVEKERSGSRATASPVSGWAARGSATTLTCSTVVRDHHEHGKVGSGRI